jgi:hypothetical protein
VLLDEASERAPVLPRLARGVRQVTLTSPQQVVEILPLKSTEELRASGAERRRQISLDRRG